MLFARNGVVRRAAFAALIAWIIAAPAYAQPNEAELRDRLAELERQIQAERDSIDAFKQTHEVERRQQQERRSALAEQLLDTRLQIEANAVRIEALRPQVEALDAEAEQVESTADATVAAASSAAERLRIMLSETPGHEDACERLRQAGRVLAEADDAVSNDTLDALRVVAHELGAAHREATSVTVRPVEIYTADGRRERVRLLSVGLAKFAYMTDSGDRIGVALSSPTDASGYRWSEAIDARTARTLRQAIKTIDSGVDGVVSVPLDPTGRVQPQTLEAEQTLEERARAGGPVMIPLAAVALLALLLVIERLYVLYGRNRRAAAVAQRVMSACRDGRYDDARDISRRAGGAIGRVLAACLARRTRGQRAMEDSVQEQLLQEMPRLNRFMGGIAILAAVAPLMGLLGTVTGIIQTFAVIRAFGNANPSLMAGGISEALITTATGLTIAIPILIVHSLLRGRADRIVADAERHAAAVLTLLVHDQQPETETPDQPKPERELQEAGVD